MPRGRCPGHHRGSTCQVLLARSLPRHMPRAGALSRVSQRRAGAAGEALTTRGSTPFWAAAAPTPPSSSSGVVSWSPSARSAFTAWGRDLSSGLRPQQRSAWVGVLGPGGPGSLAPRPGPVLRGFQPSLRGPSRRVMRAQNPRESGTGGAHYSNLMNACPVSLASERSPLLMERYGIHRGLMSQRASRSRHSRASRKASNS